MTRPNGRASEEFSSETATRRSLRTQLLATVAVGAVATFGLSGKALANPTGPSAQGATVTGAGTSSTTVTLSGQRAIIDWKTFNIGAGDTTTFLFNSNAGIALNRVNSGSATINGNLFGCVGASCSGNNFGGNIWIYARDGVFIGNGAVIDTGGFLATTSPMATVDQEFLNPSTDQFDFGSSLPGGSVQVQAGAHVNGNGGTLAFIAPQVSTAQGSSVSAPNGKNGSVLYGAAQSYRVKFAPDATTGDMDLVNFDVPAGQAGGSGSTTPISLQGATKAGNIYVAAVTKQSVADAMISIGGTQLASQASVSAGGDIVLSAGGGIANGQAAAATGGPSGRVSASVSGTLQATHAIGLYSNNNLTVSGSVTAGQANGSGGTIVATASNTVDVTGTASFQASGTKGGTILIGGDVHGGAVASQNFVSQTVTDAQTTTIEKGAQISATGSSGSGGDVVIWSNTKTNFSGLIDAQGFLSGGFAEVSSHQTLAFGGSVDLRSQSGKTGTLLLDPEDVYIETGSSTGGSFDGGTPIDTYAPAADNSVITPTDLEAELAIANVVVTTGSTGTQNGDIHVLSEVDWNSGNTLTLNAAGSIFVDALLNGSATDLVAGNKIQFDAGGAITTTGGQIYESPVVMAADTTLTDSGAGVRFESTLDGNQALTITGNAEFDAAIGSTTNLHSLTVTGTTDMNGGAIKTGQNQTYDGAVTLGQNTTLNASGTIDFGSTVDDTTTAGAQSLVVYGKVEFDGAVGGNLALGGVSLNSSAYLNGGSITTTDTGGHFGNQSYNANVTLGTNTTLTSTGGLVRFGGNLNDTGTAGAQSLSVTGNAEFDNAVGGTLPLASITVTGTTNLNTGLVTTTDADGGSGNQTYDGAVTLSASSGLTSTGGLVDFGSTVDAASAGVQGLTINGNAEFGGVVGGTNALGSLEVTGTTVLAGGAITTANDQDYDSAVTLSADTALTSAGGNVQFGTTVDGAHALTVSGQAQFAGAVGAHAPLSSLTVTGGPAVLNGGSIATSGDQDYEAAAYVIVDTTLTSASGLVDFHSTVDGYRGNPALTITGNAEFDGVVGGTMPLASIAVSGTSLLEAGAITTTDTQTYSGAATLGADTTLTASKATFGSTLDGAYGLTVTGDARFDGVVGGITPLTSLSVSGMSQLFADDDVGNIPTVVTTGDQTYSGAVWLGANTTLESGGTIDFKAKIDGPSNLTITGPIVTGENTQGNVVFEDELGSSSELQTLTVIATAAIDTDLIHVRGSQFFEGTVTLGAATALDSDAGVTDFKSTLDGAYDLTVNGSAEFDGAVGGITPLSSLTVNGATLLDASGIVGPNVTTSGNQAYNGAVTIGADNTLTSSRGNIAFDSTLDSTRSGSEGGGLGGGVGLGGGGPSEGGSSTGHALTVNANLITFDGAVGGTGSLSSLTVNDPIAPVSGIDIDGGSVTTSGNQTYNGAVALGADTTLTSTSGLVDFGGAVDGAHALSVSGNAEFDNPVGGNSPLSSLSVSGTTAIYAGARYGEINTSGNQTYTGAVTLGEDSVLTSTGGTVDFGSTLDGTYALTVTGNAEFDGAVGSNAQLTSVSISGTTVLNGGLISTTGNQTYTGEVTLAQDATLTSNSGTVDLQGGVDASSVGAQGLTITGNGEFDSSVGSTAALGFVTVSGATTLSDAVTITTTNAGSESGNQTFNGAVGLGSNLNDTYTFVSSGGLVRFEGAVDGTYAGEEVLNVTGNAEFDGDVGDIKSLASLSVSGTTDINAGAITTTGDQTYSGAVTLSKDTTLFSGGLVDFGGTVDGAQALSITGNAEFDDAVGGTTPLTSVSVSGTTDLNGGAVSTTGGQTYTGAVTVSADTTLTDTGAGIDFVSTVDGGANLTAIAASGTVTFGGAVGSTTPLVSVAAEADQLNIDGNITATGNIFLQGGPSGIGFGSLTLDSTGSGTVSLEANPAAIVGTALTVDAGTFEYAPFSESTILRLNSGGVSALLGLTTTLDVSTIRIGAVTEPGTGLTIRAGGITVDQTGFSVGTAGLELDAAQVGGLSGNIGIGGAVTAGSLTANAAGTITLDDSSAVPLVSTTGGQTYNGAVSLAADATLQDTGTGIDFKSTVDGAQNLAITGNAEFDGAVGGTTPLASLSVSASTELNGGSVSTSGNQTYSGAVTLTSDNTLTSSSGLVDFQSTVDGAQNLTVTGNAEFDGEVGTGTTLTSLSVSGTTDINIDSISTTGDQTYIGAVTVGENSTLTSTSGTIDFKSTVDPATYGNQSLTLSAATVTFEGTVGNADPLSTLSVTATDAINLDGTHITTQGGQTYDGPVVLGIDTILSDTIASGVTFESTLDGGYTLTSGTSGLTTFDGVVGGITPLAELTVNGTAKLDSSAITTTGSQFYTGAVTLAADTTLTGGIYFESMLDGAHALTVSGDAEFDDVVGGTTPLASISVSGATSITTAAISTSGNQTYSGAVTLDADTTLTSGTGLVDFGSTLNGQQALTVTGNAEFDGVVGGTTPLASINVSGNTTINTSAITTTGDQLYNTVTLAADATLEATGSAELEFNAIDGAHALTVLGPDSLIGFDGTIGGTTPLSSLTAEGAYIGVEADVTSSGNVFLQGTQSNGAEFANDPTIQSTGLSGTVSVQVDSFSAPTGVTFQANTFEYAPYTSGTALTLGASGPLAGATLDVNNLRFGAVSIPGAGGLTTTAGDITISGFDAGGINVELDSNGAITQTGALTNVGTLSGNAASVDLENAGNTLIALGTWYSSGDFKLTDDAALAVNGDITAGYTNTTGDLTLTTLGAANGITLNGNLTAMSGHSQTVTLDSAAGITQTSGIISADIFTASAQSDVTLGDVNNITTVTSLDITGGQSFSLTVDTNNLVVTGIIDPVIVSLVNTGGGIDMSGAAIIAEELTGYAAGDAILTNSGNQIGTLEAFHATGSITLTDSIALQVDGLDVKSLGYGMGVVAGSGGTAGNLSLTTTSGGITLNAALTAQSGNAQTITLDSAGTISETASGALNADVLTGSSIGTTDLSAGTNAVTTLGSFTTGDSIATSGDFKLADATPLAITGTIDTDVTPGTFSAGSAGAVTLTDTGGGIDASAGGIKAASLTGSATGNTLFTGTNAIASLGGFTVTTGGGFALADSAALTVTNNVSAPGNIYLATSNAGGITFNAGTPPLQLTSTGNGLVSLQADGLDFATVTVATGSTLEYAPYTSGNAVTVGAGGALDSANFEPNVGLIRVGAVTEPGASSTTTTAGEIDVTDAFNFGPIGLEFDASTATGGTGKINIDAALTAGSLVASTDDTISIHTGTVTTTGVQTYNGAVDVTADTALSASTVTFDSTVDGAHAVAITGNAVFDGTVGGGTGLTSLSVSGTTAMNTAAVSTSGNQTYGGDVTLAQDTTLTSTGGTVDLQGGADATSVGAQGLTIAGNGEFDGSVGSNTALGFVTVTGSTVLSDAISVNTTTAGSESGNQTFEGAVGLGSNLTDTYTFVSTGGLVRFEGAVDGTYSGQEVLDVVGNGEFDSTVGATTPLGALSVSGTTTLNGASIATTDVDGHGANRSGNQTYTGAVTLAGDSTLTSVGGLVDFASTVDGAHALAVTGNAEFDGVVGQTTALASLSVSGTADLNTDAIATSGDQTWSGETTLTANTTFKSTAGTVDFAGGLDGAHALTVTGNAEFDGEVGQGTMLTSIAVSGTTDINTDAISTSGGQTYSGAATLAADTTLASTGGTVDFGATLNGAHALTVTGNAEFDGEVGQSTGLTSIAVSGTTDVDTDAITTTGDQTYSGATTLAHDPTFTGTLVDFASTLNGGYPLIVVGNAEFDGEVGQNTTLSSISVSGTTDINTDKISTTGSQTYTGAATLATGTTLASASGTVGFGSTLDGTSAGGQSLAVTGNASFGGDVGLNFAPSTISVSGTTSDGAASIATTGTQTYTGAVTLTTDSTFDAGGLVDFASAVDGGYELSVINNVEFDGIVGGGTALHEIQVDGTTAIDTTAITTTASQGYSGNVTLGSDTTLKGTSAVFGGTLNGGHALTVTGNAEFDGEVGQSAALSSTSVSGTTKIDTDKISTTGSQTYTGNATLATSTTLASTSGTVGFGAQIDGTSAGGQSLTITGNASFGGDIGDNKAPSTIAVSGTTSDGAGFITTTGTQTYTGAVTLTADSTFDAGGLVDFAATINGAHALSVSNNVEFDGVAGGTAALASIGVGGTTDINTTAITTSGNQTYSGAATLAKSATLKSTSGTVDFGSTLDGDYGLTVTGNAEFDGEVGQGTALTGIAVSGTTDINTDAITTTGNQTYSGATTISVDTTLTSNTGTVDFGSTLDGAHSLTVDGAAEFDGEIGQGTALTSLVLQDAADINTDKISTSNTITFQGAVTLAHDTTLSATNAINIDAAVNGAHALSTVSSNTFIDASIGGTTPLTSLSVTGRTTFGGGNVTTSGGQTYGGAATLDSDTTLASTGGTVDFGSTLNGAQTLAVTGNAEFDGEVGQTHALTSLSVSGTTDINTDKITTSGGQTYTGAVTLTADSTFDAGGLVDFAATINGAHALSVSNNVEFDGIVGGTTALASIGVGGTTDINTTAITTSGGQTYTGAATLAASSTLKSTSGTVDFASTLDGDYGLTVTGNAEFDGEVGQGTALTGIAVSGTTDINTDAITTTGNQTYSGATTISVDTTLTSNTGTVDFGSTLDGAHSLTVDGAAEFDGEIGQGTALTSLVLQDAADINTDKISTSNTITFQGAVTLAHDTTLSATNAINIDAAVNGAHALSTVSSNTFIDASIGGTTPLTSLSVTGRTTFGGGNVTTSGGQTYGGAAMLDSDTTLASTGGTVDFGSTLNGAQTLAVTGNAEFDGEVGQTHALTSLSVSGTTDINTDKITTSGGQTYTGAATLAHDPTFTGTLIDFGSTLNGGYPLIVVGNAEFDGEVGQGTALTSISVSGTTDIDTDAISTTGGQTYTGAVTLARNTTLASTSGLVDFKSTVNGAQSLDVSGNAEFDGAVGGTTALTGVDVSGTAALDGGTVKTAGSQIYQGAVTLGADTTLTDTAAQGTFFGSTINGAYALTVNEDQLTTFVGNVGSTSALTSLTTDAAGSTKIDAATITTTGAQTYNDAVALGASTTLASTGGSAIDFAKTVNGAFGLATDTTGTTTFGGAVGSTTGLASVSVDGPVAINGGAVTTTGGQTYSGAATLGAATTLTGSLVDFGSTLDGAQSLTVDGNAEFDGAVGGTTVLTSVDVTGTTALDGGAVSTAGSQTYQGAVTLGADTTLTDTGATGIAFDTTVNGAYALSVSANELTSFGGTVGGTTALTSLTTTGEVQLGANITTTGAQTYNDAVNLAATVTLASTSGGAIAFDGLVEGGYGLEASSTGTTTFNEGVGGKAALTSVTVTGPVAINGGGVTTTGNQTYSGAATLGADTTLASTSGLVDFGSTLNGDQALTVTGKAEFDGEVGQSIALASIAVSGTTDVNTDAIATTGSQTYSGATTLSHDPTFTGTLIDFGSTLNGGYPLSVVGNAEFDGEVGQSAALTSIAVSGTTDINTDKISTTGGQTYSGEVTLAQTAALASTSGTVDMQGGVDAATAGAQGLTISGKGEFDGSVGATNPLASLAVTGTTVFSDAISVNTTSADSGSGNQTFGGAVTLGSNLSDTYTFVSTGGLVRFEGTVDGTYSGEEVLKVTGNAEFDGNVGSTVALGSLSVSGTTDLNGVSVTTTDVDGHGANRSGNQTYSGAVTLGGSSTLVSTGGLVDFGSTVNGAHALTVTGNAEFDDAVGGATALTGVSVTGTTDLNGNAVTTSGNQTYTGAATLGTSNTLTSSTGTVDFGSTLNGAHALTVAGNAEFDGAVGGGTALTNLSVSGTTALDGGAITTESTQTYTGAATLGEDTTLTSRNTALIKFGSTLDGTYDIIIVGNVEFQGEVGQNAPLQLLAVTGTADIDTDKITTAVEQDYEGAVSLSSNSTLTATSGYVNFDSTVDGGYALTLNATGSSGLVAFNGAVGSNTPLASLTINAAKTELLSPNIVSLGNSITTVGTQVYNSPVLLYANNVLTASTVTFDETVDAALSRSLQITGNAEFDGEVGQSSALASIAVSGTTDVNTDKITTTGSQTYSGATTLAHDPTFTGALIDFGSTLDGAYPLIVVGNAEFDAAVGSTTPLTSISVSGTTDMNGNAITTTGAQTYTGAVTLATDNTLTSGSLVDFGATVDGAHALTASANAEFDGTVGGGTALSSLSVSGTTDVNTGAITTSGSQSYTGAVTLAASSTLTSSAANLTFDSTIDGAHGLTASAASGTVSFDGAVGSGTALTTLTTYGIVDINGDSITTTGAQIYNDGAILTSNDTLTSTGGNITFDSTVDGAYALTASASGGTVTFDGAVGGTTALTSLAVTGTTDLNGGAVTTSGAQTYSGAINLGAGTTLSSTASGNVTFDSTIDGAYALAVDTGGVTKFLGAVGSNTPLASITTDAPGSTDLNGGPITTTGAQVYNDPVTLSADANLTSTGSGAITFGQSVDGAYTLTTDTAGQTSFLGSVGATTTLVSLDMDGTGSVDLNGGAISTSTNQTYDGAVILSANTTLTAPSVTFGSTVDATTAGGESLTVNGNATFDGKVGGTTPLSSLTTSGGALAIAASITTTGNQSYTVTGSGNGIDVPAGDTLTSTGGNVSFTTTSPATDITVEGTVSATTGTATFTAAGNIGESTGSIDAATLTGSSGGTAAFTGSANDIGTLAGFTNTAGAFSLTDNAPLTVTGTLNAAGQTATLADTNGGIAAGGAVIDAATLAGSSTGAAIFTNASNTIGTLGNFTNSAGAFSLTDNQALTINGTLNAAGQSVTLADTADGIAASAGAIDAATLTGSTKGAAVFTGASNAVGTLAGFTNTSGAFSLTDNAALTVTGTLNAAGQTVSLNDTAGGIAAGAGAIDATTLNGSSKGAATFTDASNTVATLGSFTNTSGAFSLTDNQALTVNGTLNATGQSVTLTDTAGGIAAGAGAIDAASLTGSTTGAATFTDASNAIGTLGTFSNAGGDFALTDSTSLDIVGTLNAAGHNVTLTETGGNILASSDVIDAATFTGSSNGSALFTGANQIGTLNGYQTGGSFALTDAQALLVNGPVTANTASSGGTLTLLTTGATSDGITLAGNLTDGPTSGAQTMTVTAAGAIAQNAGTVTGGTVIMTAGTSFTINDANASGAIVAGNATLAANGGDFTILAGAGGTEGSGKSVISTTGALAMTASSDILVEAGTISSGTTASLTAGNNILIGEPDFIAKVQTDLLPIDQAINPILAVVNGPNGGLYQAEVSDHGVNYQNYVFLSTQSLVLTAPKLVVSENTGTLPSSGGGFKPAGILIDQPTVPYPDALKLSGGSATGTAPTEIDLYGSLEQGGGFVAALDVADSAQVGFGGSTQKNNAYLVNGCIIHNLNSCTITSFTIQVMDPNKQAQLQIIAPDDQGNDELDLTISGAGNDEIWEDEE